MRLPIGFLVAVDLLCALPGLHAQETTQYRSIGVTFNTSAPAQLAIDRGRLIWRDTDVNTGDYLLKYYSGAEIFTLDSGLAGVTAAINGDVVVWNTPGELVKAFDVRTWETTPIGISYNPDSLQPVAACNGLVAYAQRNAGTGTHIVLHHLSSGSDTMLSAGTWNTSPSLHQGQLAWVASDSEGMNTSSDIFFFDGVMTRNLSGTAGVRNRDPILRDGDVAWLQSGGGSARVKIFTGDSVITLAQTQTPTAVITGYDLSGGVAVAAVRDTLTGGGSLRIFDSETGATTVVPDSNGPSSPHFGNNLLVWQSGSGVDRRIEIYDVHLGLRGEYSGGEKPVVSVDEAAWTNGDAVEMYAPYAQVRLTNDGANGWQQTKFKTIDSTHVVWGNFSNSLNMRLFYGDGVTQTELSDSSTTVDLVMANDGYVIWRRNFDSLYYYDGEHVPVKFLDTVQSENAYVAGGSIGFFGARTAGGDPFKHPWLYQIGAGKLTELASDSSDAWNVLCDGNTACWLNRKSNRLMFYDGAGTIVLSDSDAGYDYSYRNGTIVWTEKRNGHWQVMLYDVAQKARVQLTTSGSEKFYPITDGSHVVWYEAIVASPIRGARSAVIGAGSPPFGPVMMYYDVRSGQLTYVANGNYNPLFWNWMSDGKIAWLQANGSIVAYDGEVISVLQPNDGFRTYSGVYLDQEIAVWKATVGVLADNSGDVYRQKLCAHPAFDASGIAGKAPLPVRFVNRSWEGARTYFWDFGDGSSSTELDPVHTYVNPGKYSVTLTVSGPTGPATTKKINLVRVQSATDVAEEGTSLPLRFELSQNYPNPFNPSTIIKYTIAGAGGPGPGASNVELVVYDLLGRKVAVLVNERKVEGSYEVSFDGSRLASGVYLCRLTSGGFVETRTMILLK
jgi:PKD repeat protein